MSSSSSIEDIWSSLQSEENSKRIEYKNRYESIKKKANEKNGGNNVNLVELMEKSSNSLRTDASRDDIIGHVNQKKKKTEKSKNSKTNQNSSICVEEKILKEKEESKVGISAADLSNKISKHVLGCNSDEAGVRRRSLQHLIEEIFIKHSLSAQDYNTVFHDICKTVFRLYADSVEKCRELSLQLTLLFFDHCRDVLPVLSYFFPAIMQRLPANIGYDEDLSIFVYDKSSHEAYRRGKAVDRQDKVNPSESAIVPFTYVESSEEIRLLSYQVFKMLISRLTQVDAVSILQPYFNEIIMYVQIGLRDPYPNVKIEVLDILDLLVKQEIFELGLKFYAVAIVRAILPVLRHRHAKIRAKAIYTMISYIATPDKAKRKGAGTDAISDLIGFHEENVLQIASFYTPQIQVNYLAELSLDSTFIVREATVKMLDIILSELPDRYDHTGRLLPYLLDFLTDENHETVVNIALNCLAKCGKMYEEEHQDEIIERRQYGVDGDSRMNVSKPLPFPFESQRPRLGIRLYAKGHIKRFLNVLIKEIMNWKADTRLKSVKLLKVVVILSEESITIEASSLFPALLKVIKYTKYEETDMAVYKCLMEVTELLGRFIHPDVYMHYLMPRLKGDVEIIGGMGVDSNTRIVVLEFMNSLLSGTKLSEAYPYIFDVLECICDEYIISRDSVSLQKIGLEAMINMLQLISMYTDTAIGKTSIDKNTHVIYENTFEFLLRNIIYFSSKDICYDQSVHALRLLCKVSSIGQRNSEEINMAEDDILSKCFVSYGQNLIMKLLNVSVDADYDISEVNDVLPLLHCLVNAPCHIVHVHTTSTYSHLENLLAFVLKISDICRNHIDNGTLHVSGIYLSDVLVSVANITIAALSPLVYESYPFHSANKYYRQLFNLPNKRIPGISYGQNDTSVKLVMKYFPSILQSFVLNSVWNRNSQLDSVRFDVLCLVVGCCYGCESQDDMMLVRSLLVHQVQSYDGKVTTLDDTVETISKYIFPILSVYIQPTIVNERRQTIAYMIGFMVKLVARKYDVSMQKVVSFKSSMISTRVEWKALVLVHRLQSILLDMLSDGSDAVRITVLDSLLWTVPFTLSDDSLSNVDSNGMNTFSKVSAILLNELIHYRQTSILTSQQELSELGNGIESVLRSLAVLDPTKMEELVRLKYSIDLSDENKTALSELIDHSSLLAQLQSYDSITPSSIESNKPSPSNGISKNWEIL